MVRQTHYHKLTHPPLNLGGREGRVMNQKRVVVAMSGGVDSSVCAALLKKQGFDVIGVFLKFWKDPKVRTELENICCSTDALLAARTTATQLKIPFYVLDASREFKKMVVDYFIKEYESGRTPNPCVMCNQFIKFDWLIKKAKILGADYVATGHYARLRRGIYHPSPLSLPQGEKTFARDKSTLDVEMRKLFRAKDKKKDQSYFLWTLNQKQLKHLLFPIGEYTKDKIRFLAKRVKLPTAARKESQGICFIPDRNTPAFLKRYAKKLTKPGKIVDSKGNILGRHKGLVFYTIGQRERLGIGGQTKPLYVLKLDIKKNQLVVGLDKDLYKKELVAEKINWIDQISNIKYQKLKIKNQKFYPERSRRVKIKAQIRYGHKAESATLYFLSKKRARIVFKKPVRAITPGQSVVFYRKEQLLGGGIIINC
jgi:tRNA-specific 2-thiouridylase